MNLLPQVSQFLTPGIQRLALQEFFIFDQGVLSSMHGIGSASASTKKSQRPNGTDQVTAYGGKLQGTDLRDRSQKSCIQQHGWLHQNDESAENSASS